MYDAVIVGGGPAGLAAAVYLARHKLNFIMLTGDIGGQTLWSSDVENYLGFHLIDGVKLVGEFKKHLEYYKDAFELHEGEPVTNVERADRGFRVTTEKGSYDTKTVLIAKGETHRRLNVPGEKELYGHGVTYCATCDAPLFSGKDVEVIGGGNSAMDAAIQLIKIAGKIYIIDIAEKLSADMIMQQAARGSPKVTVLNGVSVTAIAGHKMVTAIKIKKEGKEEFLPVQGVFVEIGLNPNSEFAPEVEKNELGELKVNPHNQTNIPGIFASGDVTDVPEKQIVIAAGEGSKACLSAFKYLIMNPPARMTEERL